MFIGERISFDPTTQGKQTGMISVPLSPLNFSSQIPSSMTVASSCSSLSRRARILDQSPRAGKRRHSPLSRWPLLGPPRPGPGPGRGGQSKPAAPRQSRGPARAPRKRPQGGTGSRCAWARPAGPLRLWGLSVACRGAASVCLSACLSTSALPASTPWSPTTVPSDPPRKRKPHLITVRVSCPGCDGAEGNTIM